MREGGHEGGRACGREGMREGDHEGEQGLLCATPAPARALPRACEQRDVLQHLARHARARLVRLECRLEVLQRRDLGARRRHGVGASRSRVPQGCSFQAELANKSSRAGLGQSLACPCARPSRIPREGVSNFTGREGTTPPLIHKGILAHAP